MGATLMEKVTNLCERYGVTFMIWKHNETWAAAFNGEILPGCQLTSGALLVDDAVDAACGQLLNFMTMAD